MECCGFECIKYSLIILNVLFVFSGIFIISAGVYMNTYYFEYNDLVDEQYVYAPVFLIVLGAIIFLIAFLGCYGTCTENSCMNLTFSTFLVLIFFFELALGIGGYIMKDSVEATLKERLVYSMHIYQNNSEVKAAWDEVQTDFKCCGIEGPNDWPQYNLSLPFTCCSYSSEKSPTLTAPCGDLHKFGCLEAFGDYIRDNSRYIQIVGLSLALIQLFGIICSCYLAHGFRKGYEII